MTLIFIADNNLTAIFVADTVKGVILDTYFLYEYEELSFLLNYWYYLKDQNITLLLEYID
jgi:hypothetical protein